MNESSKTDLTHQQAEALGAFSKTMRRELHVLTQRPDLVWQQLFNHLQWEGKTLLVHPQVPFLEHLVNRICGNCGTGINCNGQGNGVDVGEIFMSETYDWSSFYEALCMHVPNLLLGIDDELREMIEIASSNCGARTCFRHSTRTSVLRGTGGL